jgi:hypothetical protein
MAPAPLEATSSFPLGKGLLALRLNPKAGIKMLRMSAAANTLAVARFISDFSKIKGIL